MQLFNNGSSGNYEPYKVGALKIKSATVVYSEEFCIECDKVMPFIDYTACLGCSCFNPFGDFYDDSISEEEWEEYFRINRKTL